MSADRLAAALRALLFERDEYDDTEYPVVDLEQQWYREEHDDERLLDVLAPTFGELREAYAALHEHFGGAS